MLHPRVRHLFQRLRYTPIHPQWLTYRDETRLLAQVGRRARGLVLDVGCAHQRLRPYLAPDCQYYGMDYYQTAKTLYATKPDVFGDAQKLPFPSSRADTVVLMEVLEHLPDPGSAIREAHRVLKAGGELIVTVPFLYPIHDAPHDFQRWTRFGLKKLATSGGFILKEETCAGKPSETAALLVNIAAAALTLNLLERKNPFSILALIVLAALVPVVNVVGWLCSACSGADALMPFGYRLVLTKAG